MMPTIPEFNDDRDYCEICENILNEYEGDVCCSCEERLIAEEIKK